MIRISAPNITRSHEDLQDVSGRVDKRIRTVVGDVVVRVSLAG